jgi:hypothetical protein
MNSTHHLHWTYRQVRIMAGVALIAIPVIIVAIGYGRHQIILPTLSHYYFGESIPGLLRTLFTGFLVLVGGLMLVYRGFDDKDNWIHNVAGLLAIAVALFPKGLDDQDIYRDAVRYPIMHGASAVLLFFVAAYAVIYSGGSNLQSRLNKGELALLRKWRIASVAGMLSGAIAYAPFIFLKNPDFLPPSGVLLVEMTGFFGFAFYWLGMTHVIHNANLRLTASISSIPGNGNAPANDSRTTGNGPGTSTDAMIP